MVFSDIVIPAALTQIFDYNSATRGFIDPESIFISYKVSFDSPTATAGHV